MSIIIIDTPGRKNCARFAMNFWLVKKNENTWRWPSCKLFPLKNNFMIVNATTTIVWGILVCQFIQSYKQKFMKESKRRRNWLNLNLLVISYVKLEGETTGQKNGESIPKLHFLRAFHIFPNILFSFPTIIFPTELHFLSISSNFLRNS